MHAISEFRRQRDLETSLVEGVFIALDGE